MTKSKCNSYISLLIILLPFACSKVTKKVNSEKNFTLYFTNQDGSPANVCFDKVYGENRPPITLRCSNLTLGIQLPLNFTTKNSRFFFVSGSQTDTLTVHYQTFYVNGNGEMEVDYQILDIETSFDSLSTKCNLSLNQTCNGDQAYLSASIVD
jgi:hypothetical protein